MAEKMKGLGGAARSPRRPARFFEKKMAPLDELEKDLLEEEVLVEEPVEEQPPREKRKKVVNRQGDRNRRGRVEFKIDGKRRRVIERLVVKLRREGAQPDASATELICGALDHLGNIEKHISFRDVPQRGRWGSSEAESFKLAIGQAISDGAESWRTEDEEQELFDIPAAANE